MTVAPDFFETEPRNWRARLAVSVEVMRELSRSTDPQEMYAIFARRIAQLFPVSRHLTISRRGLRNPEYRVARFSQWKDPINPWKESHRLPAHHGGLLAELLYGDQPRVIDAAVRVNVAFAHCRLETGVVRRSTQIYAM